MRLSYVYTIFAHKYLTLLLMNATISMDGLWAIVDSLSVKNKKWLADRLRKSIADSSKGKEEEILTGISKSLQQAKQGDTFPLDRIWSQL